MQSWAAQELQHVQLGDRRLDRRLIRLVEDLAAQPTASVAQACGSWAACKAAYRFWDNPRVTPEAIRAAHCRTTRDALRASETILVLQDTTELDWTSHPKTGGLGPLAHPSHHGLHVHSALVVTDAGVPLGLIHQHVWARDPAAVGQRHRRRQRLLQEKESQRWLTALQTTQTALPAEVRTITVADREADIYDLFALPRRPGSELLIRAAHNRRVDHEARHLWAAIGACPAAGELTVRVGRRGDQPEREACLTVRFSRVAVLPPRHHPRRRELAPIELGVVLAEEAAPPPGVQPVKWLLFTTLPVTDLEEAQQCVRWYSLRWLIERYHFVLKSGCRLEARQLAQGERLQRALATYSLVAWRLLWLTYEAREHPETPCDTVLEAAEWQALYAATHQTQQVPAQPPSLREAVHGIARLGGFLGRRRDGEPGVKTLWQGLQRLHDLATMWHLLHSSPPQQRPPGLVGNA